MALPSKPDKLRLGSYDRDGNDLSTDKEKKKAFAVHALSDSADPFQSQSTTVFNIQGGF